MPHRSLIRLLAGGAALVAAAGVLAAPPAHADALVPPYLASVTFGGTGCPQGTVGSSYANDRSAATFIVDSLAASTGPSVPFDEARKACTPVVKLAMGADTTALLTVDYRGYVEAPASTTADLSVLAALADGTTATSGATFQGPVSKDYLHRVTLCVSATTAGTSLLELTEVVALSPSAQQAQITNDSIDMKISAVSCTGSPTLPLRADTNDSVQVDSISYGGTGCPQGAVASTFTDDRRHSVLAFDDFAARTGPGVPVTENRKNCQLNVNVRSDAAEATERVVTVTTRGGVILPAGASAETTASAVAHSEVLDTASVSTDGPATAPVTLVQRLCLALDPASVTVLGVNEQTRLPVPSSTQSLSTVDTVDVLVGGPCTPPTVSVTTPVEGAMYGLGTTVTPAVTCTAGGAPIDSCTYPATLDTSTVGPHTFTATATDAIGQSATVTVNYTVGGKDECKNGGHGRFANLTFKNQGLCVSYFSTRK